MSSARAAIVAALSVLLLSASLLSAQDAADETWFGAAVMRGTYLYPRALGVILFGQTSRSGEVQVFAQILGLPNGVSAHTRYAALHCTAQQRGRGGGSDRW